jgi:hypothetical protein
MTTWDRITRNPRMPTILTLHCASGHSYNVSTPHLVRDNLKHCHEEDRDELLDALNAIGNRKAPEDLATTPTRTS